MCIGKENINTRDEYLKQKDDSNNTILYHYINHCYQFYN